MFNLTMALAKLGEDPVLWRRYDERTYNTLL